MGRYLVCQAKRATREEAAQARRLQRQQDRARIDAMIRELARRGHDAGRIGARVGRSIRYVYGVLGAAGLKARPHRQSNLRIVLLLHRGLTVRQASAELGMSIESIRSCRRFAREAGWTL